MRFYNKDGSERKGSSSREESEYRRPPPPPGPPPIKNKCVEFCAEWALATQQLLVDLNNARKWPAENDQ